MAGITAPQRTRKSRKPTGRPNPPIVLITGQEKTGKSWEAARGSGSDLIGNTYWIEIGGTEGTADYYGRVPGARYEIVEHDGSYQDILDAIRWSIQQPRVDGKLNMLVIDSVTSLWDMLSDEIALFARRRAVRKAQENRRRAPSTDDPVVVDADLWNRAKDRWGEVLWLLRRHPGPVLLIARQEVVTAFENDKPTRNTTRKVKAEKNLPAAVDAIVELHAVGEAWLTGVRTLHMSIQPGESQRFPDFSVDTLLRRLGIQDAVESRSVSELRPDGDLQEHGQQPEPTTVRADPPRPAPALSNEQAAQLIRDALMHPIDPEGALRELREDYGRRVLKAVQTNTAWGQMNADELITKSLDHLKAKAEQATAGEHSDDSKERQAPQEQTHDSAPTDTQAPEPDGQGFPPPDPEEQPPVDEHPEDVSEAEEPQDLPRPRPAQMNKANKAMAVLLTEAEIQARLLGVPMEEHLAPIARPDDGTPPPMTKLRTYVIEHRDTVIALLEEQGQRDIANAYRLAGKPELKIAAMFSTLYDDLVTVG
ncbi:AAA family ATPase [Streptomyces sp. NPDC050485]|uniref:AAA family ATPase n=1 Tax=Streptomyces sp. NPDC050485 TaxID=3365617 RepID=UPI00379B59CC